MAHGSRLAQGQRGEALKVATDFGNDLYQHRARERLRERLERQALEGELNRWGRWIERHFDYEGYPGVNIIESYLQGRGGGTGGHKILCLDWPSGIYAIHRRLLMVVPDAEREALWMRYCVRLKPDGTLWSETEIALRAGIDIESWRKRIWRAKQRLLGLVY